MKKRKVLVVGNWKLNPGNVVEAKSLALGVKKTAPKNTETVVAVAPPFIFIPEVQKALAKSVVFLGAQDVHFEERGAVTGEIGTGMLQAFGVKYVIIGHSERRALGETDEQVNKKIQAVLKKGLTPIVCIGEKDRDKQGLFFNFVGSQVKALTSGLTPVQLQKVVIAYEPIWAIGTGLTATVEDVKEMQLFIVSTLAKLYERKVAEKVMILYGGSVKSSNAKELHVSGDMNGFLVGGASLDPKEFSEIIKATI